MKNDNIIWIIFIFLEFILTLVFCEKIYTKEKVRRFSILLFSTIIFCNYITIIRFDIKYTLSVEVILLIVTLVIPFILSPQNYSKNIFVSVIYSTGMFLISNLSVFAWITLLDVPIRNIKLLIIVEVLKLLYTFMLINIASYIDYIPTKLFLLIALLCLIMRALIIILIVFANKYSESFGYTLLFISCILFMIYMLIMVIIVIFSSYLKKYSRNAAENDKLRYITEYSDTALNAFEDMKLWNHDLRNHMSVILSLLESQSESEIKKYINDLNIETSKLEGVIYTDNFILDSLLNTKINYADKHNIKINLEINFKQPIYMNELDIVTLMSNLLDNAIESCERIPENRWIDIYLKTENYKFIIKIKNTTDGNLDQSIFKTRKKSGSHGIGLVQIDKIVNKYNGYVDRNHHDNIFNTVILLIHKPLP